MWENRTLAKMLSGGVKRGLYVERRKNNISSRRWITCALEHCARVLECLAHFWRCSRIVIEEVEHSRMMSLNSFMIRFHKCIKRVRWGTGTVCVIFSLKKKRKWEKKRVSWSSKIHVSSYFKTVSLLFFFFEILIAISILCVGVCVLRNTPIQDGKTACDEAEERGHTAVAAFLKRAETWYFATRLEAFIYSNFERLFDLPSFHSPGFPSTWTNFLKSITCVLIIAVTWSKD